MASLRGVLALSARAALATSAVLLSVALLRALTTSKPRVAKPWVTSATSYISDAQRNLSARFARALTFQTITWDTGDFDTEPLIDFHQYLRETFPHIYSSPLVTVEVVSNFSLLYVVRGSDERMKPYMFYGHMDVAPVKEEDWERAPFGGEIIDGEIWGRGAIDSKVVVMGVMEALEYLLASGYHPKRTLYVGFGHDDEAHGVDGASNIAKLLQSRRLRFDYILVKGYCVIVNAFRRIPMPFAMIGVTEKGALTFKMTARSPTSYHAALPPRESTIVTLSKALVRFRTRSLPSLYGGKMDAEATKIIASYAPFWTKLILVNAWLFKPLIMWMLESSRFLSCYIRTTTAVTAIHAGVKDNVAPSKAHAYIYQRIHPLQTIETVMDCNREMVSDVNVTMKAIWGYEPLPVSPYGPNASGYRVLSHTLHEVFPGTGIIPGLMGELPQVQAHRYCGTLVRCWLPYCAASFVSSSGAKHFRNLSDAIYRFTPVDIMPRDIYRIHGDDERVGVLSYERAVNYYKQLIINSDIEPRLLHKGRTAGEL